MLREAIEYHRQGRLEEAETAYRAALAANASDGDALRGLGDVRRLRGDYAEAAELLGRALALAPDQPKLLMMLAAVQFETGQIDAARDAYQRALALDPNLSGAHTALGHIALMRNDAEGAEQWFQTALRLGEDPQALSGLGTLRLNRGDAEGAMKFLTRAADLAPNDASIAYTLGRGFARRGMLAFAEQAFRNALRLRPGQPQATSALGQLLVQDRRAAEAEVYFRRLLGVRGFDLVAELGMGDVMRQQDQHEAAATHYRNALAIKPDHEACFEALLISLGKIGRGAEVLDLLEQRIQAYPAQRRWRQTRARILSQGPRHAEALADWSALLEQDSSDAEAAVGRICALERGGDLELSARLAEASVTLAPADPQLTLVRVRARMRAGEDAAALELAQTITLDKVDATIARTTHNLIGQIHDRAGRFAEAVTHFRAAQDGLKGMLPKLDQLPADLDVADAKAGAEAWAQAPILLIGAPGSGVDRIAALIADQPGLNLLRDRVQGLRNDCFDMATSIDLDAMGEADIEAQRTTYLAGLAERGFDLAKPLIDWIPRFDAHQLKVARRLMPGTRIVLVDRDARDAFLNWLGFGWLPYAGLNQLEECANWFGRAQQHLHLATTVAGLLVLRVEADAVLADPAGAGAELARFLGIEALVPGAVSAQAAVALGGLPVGFAKGHSQHYAEALGEVFARFDAPPQNA